MSLQSRLTPVSAAATLGSSSVLPLLPEFLKYFMYFSTISIGNIYIYFLAIYFKLHIRLVNL